MITNIFITALAVNALLTVPLYHKVLGYLNLTRQPFTCVFCLAFWVNLVFVSYVDSFLLAVPLALACAYIASGIEKLYNLLPTIIK